MKPTTTTHETISAARHTPTLEQQNHDLEWPGSKYTYLGEDTEGGHHHLEERSLTVYVTDTPPERFLPKGAPIYWFRIGGTIEHVETLSPRTVREWVAYVEETRGWTQPPLLIDGTITQVEVKP